MVSAPAQAERVTAAELARRLGTSRANITQRTKRGRLHRDAEGRYPLDHELNAAALDHSTPARRSGQRRSGRTPSVPQPALVADPGPRADPGPPPQRPSPIIVPIGPTSGGNGRPPLEIDGETHAMAELRDKIAAADLKEQKLARERGDLVDRAAVADVFAAIYEVHQGQLKALAQKLGPEVAVALGVPESDTLRVQELMDLEVRRALAQIKRAMVQYLAAVGSALEATGAD